MKTMFTGHSTFKGTFSCLFTFVALAGSALAGAESVLTVEGEKVADFGKYSANLRKEATFTLINGTEQEIEIKKIRKTCGCATAEVDKKQLAPGEKTKLKAVVLSDSIYGPYRKNIYVQTDSPGGDFLTLAIAGNAVPIVEVKPEKMVSTGYLRKGVTWRKSFVLSPTEGGVELGEPTASPATGISAVLNGTGEYRLNLAVTPEKDGEDFKYLITIPVLKPEKWKPVEIAISGKVGARLAAIPPVIKLGSEKIGTPVYRNIQLRLLGPSDTDFRKSTVSWNSLPGIEVTVSNTDEVTAMVTVKITADFQQSPDKDKNQRLEFRLGTLEPAVVSIKQ